MATYPAELRYTREHEWARVEGGRARVGITAYAQEQLDLFAPVSGEVVEVNAELLKKPELVNQDPYGQGWMLVVTVSNPQEVNALLTAKQYEEFLAKGGH